MSTSLNLCNVPPWAIASRHFNDQPVPIEVQGVRSDNAFLFRRLDAIASRAERAAVFNDYTTVKFYLHQWESETGGARASLKNSYVRFLQGWGVDSNSVEGAVLKGWVESRLGLYPKFHKVPIDGVHDERYMIYAHDRMKGSARTNAINAQLDLLFAYCQYELPRLHPGRDRIVLYRGTYDAAEHDILERIGRREYYVRLNSLCSFTSDREKAWEFGSTVWQVEVPVAKVFFFGDLLPESILKGENEHLVIGGEFRVKELLV